LGFVVVLAALGFQLRASCLLTSRHSYYLSHSTSLIAFLLFGPEWRSSVLFSFVLFWVGLWFDLRASHLQSRCSTAWAIL
jgi:hypothetical protein